MSKATRATRDANWVAWAEHMNESLDVIRRQQDELFALSDLLNSALIERSKSVFESRNADLKPTNFPALQLDRLSKKISRFAKVFHEVHESTEQIFVVTDQLHIVTDQLCVAADQFHDFMAAYFQICDSTTSRNHDCPPSCDTGAVSPVSVSSVGGSGDGGVEDRGSSGSPATVAFGPVTAALLRHWDFWLSRPEARGWRRDDRWLDGYLAAIDEAIGIAHCVETISSESSASPPSEPASDVGSVEASRTYDSASAADGSPSPDGASPRAIGEEGLFLPVPAGWMVVRCDGCAHLMSVQVCDEVDDEGKIHTGALHYCHECRKMWGA